MNTFIPPLVVAMIATSILAGTVMAADAPAAAPPEVALVGCAHIHTPDFARRMKKRTDIKVQCVWDHDAERAKKYAAELGVPVAPDLAQIWNDPRIVAVVICSETDRHLDLVLAAAKAKKHIYAEKPLGFSATDSYAMADAIQKAGVLFQTGYFMRSDPVMQFLKQQVGDGAFGKITRIRGCNAHNGALGGWFDKDYRWMADPKQSGIGGFGDLGTHSLDLMLWFMHEPVDRVAAVTSTGTARYEGCDELGEGILVFHGGAIGSLASSWDDVSNPVSIEISGTEGHATVVNGKLFFQSSKVPGADGKQPWTKLPPALPHAFENFLDAVAGKKDAPLVTAPEAAYRAAVMQALYDAAEPSSSIWAMPIGFAGNNVDYNPTAMNPTIADTSSPRRRSGISSPPGEFYALFDTPIGICGIAWNDRGITRLQLPERNREETAARLRSRLVIAREGTPSGEVTRVVESIRKYLAGERVEFADLTLDLTAAPTFHRKVYRAARAVRWGQTATYGQIAGKTGSPDAARAVGQAMSRNPLAILIPCHRILAAGKKMGGFSAFGGTSVKEKLLALEGVFLI